MHVEYPVAARHAGNGFPAAQERSAARHGTAQTLPAACGTKTGEGDRYKPQQRVGDRDREREAEGVSSE